MQTIVIDSPWYFDLKSSICLWTTAPKRPPYEFSYIKETP